MFNKIIISVFCACILNACTINPYTTSAGFTYHSDCYTPTYALNFNTQHHIHSKPKPQKTVVVSNTVINNNVKMANNNRPNNAHITHNKSKIKHTHKRPNVIHYAKNDLHNKSPFIHQTPIAHKTSDKKQRTLHKSTLHNNNYKKAV